MLTYWILFGCFALGAMTRPPLSGGRRVSILFSAGIMLICLLVGLRYEVGGDWQNYVYLFHYTATVGIERAIAASDPAYQLLNWIVAQAGGTVVWVDLICAAIFCWGLDRFARSQPDPWLTVLVAVPYLVVVVAMGYTRQATAIGILMAGLASLSKGAGLGRFTLYVVTATLFHKTAVVLLPFAIFAMQRNRLANIAVGAIATFLLYRYFLADSLEAFVRHYLDAHYSSQGALIRVMMSFLPAVLFMAVGRRLGFAERDHRLWWIFSLTSVVTLGLLFVLPSSTAVDRLALYLIPLQLAVVPRAAGLFRDSRIGTLAVVGYAAAVMFVWLNFSTYASAWIPYRFAPLS